jgi:flagellar protein FlbT
MGREGEARVPLAIELKAGDKMIINGVVIENVGHNCRLLLHNHASVLRQRDILTEEKANTPAKRAYFALQCAYIFPDERDKWLGAFADYLKDYLEAAPSAAPICGDVLEEVNAERYYEGLRGMRKLLKHEEKLFAAFESATGSAAR